MLQGGLSLWGAQRTGCSANRRKGLRDSPCTPKHGVNGQFGSHGRGGREVPPLAVCKLDTRESRWAVPVRVRAQSQKVKSPLRARQRW